MTWIWQKGSMQYAKISQCDQHNQRKLPVIKSSSFFVTPTALNHICMRQAWSCCDVIFTLIRVQFCTFLLGMKKLQWKLEILCIWQLIGAFYFFDYGNYKIFPTIKSTVVLYVPLTLRKTTAFCSHGVLRFPIIVTTNSGFFWNQLEHSVFAMGQISF
jgi:hypothetical protein